MDDTKLNLPMRDDSVTPTKKGEIARFDLDDEKTTKDSESSSDNKKKRRRN